MGTVEVLLDDELAETGFGACASRIHPVTKLIMLVTVSQNRKPNFKSFISPLLCNKDLTVVGNANQPALL